MDPEEAADRLDVRIRELTGFRLDEETPRPHAHEVTVPTLMGEFRRAQLGDFPEPRHLRPEGGEVGQIAGRPVPGGSLDNAAFHTSVGVDGLPSPAKLMPVEAKNVRQWVYPRTQELYQLLDKSARLRVENPNLPVMPIFVCRRVQFLTGKMAQQLGFHVIQTRKQYVRPAVAHTDDDARKLEELNTELSYNLELHEGSVEPMVKQFTGVIPKRCDDAASRWGSLLPIPVSQI